jgi:hypothetical protein
MISLLKVTLMPGKNEMVLLKTCFRHGQNLKQNHRAVGYVPM